MLEDLINASSRIVGMKQTLKAVAEGKVNQVFLAQDVDDYIANKIKEQCQKHHIPIEYVDSMKELGKACGIDVGAATAAILNNY